MADVGSLEQLELQAAASCLTWMLDTGLGSSGGATNAKSSISLVPLLIFLKQDLHNIGWP